MISAKDAMIDLLQDVLKDKQPERYHIAGNGRMREIRIEPGRITGLGAPPGTGKTALIMQWVVDALILQPELKALICNVEMQPKRLCERILARLSGVRLSAIMDRSTNYEEKEAMKVGYGLFQKFHSRLSFCEPPYTLETVVKDGFRMTDEKPEPVLLPKIWARP